MRAVNRQNKPMNTAILIFTLLLFGLALYFGYIIATRAIKSFVSIKLRAQTKRIINLKNHVKTLEDRIRFIETHSSKEVAASSRNSANFINNMEERHVQKQKRIVEVNGVPQIPAK